MTTYWVVGGRYASTRFTDLAPGAEDVRIGPFISYDEAKAAWTELSWNAIDDCNTRYVITEAA
ncbi:MAG TPA: DUF4170 domain-containing protein [Alphaproteobacteria bacterium]|nr:DUF4170 domain-containing protein [Alphaproteobacteria bacterium]